MRIGILGGSFDPIHKGHLKLATAARRQLKLACVYLVPSKNPFKKYQDKTTAKLRVERLRRAFQGKRGFHVSLEEVKRPGPSYTIDTLLHFRRRFPKMEFYLIMGSDSLKTFKKWKKPREIVRLAQLAVGRRPGSSENLPAQIFGREVIYLEGAFPRVSSSEIRKKNAR